MNMIECRTEEEWLSERDKLVVTGSQAHELMTHPLRFYARKKGALAPIVQTERMLWGKRLQAEIGRGFGEDTGREVVPAPPFTIYLHPEAPFIGATLDFFEVDPAKGEGILETKNVSAEWDEIPLPYQVQVQVQLACVPGRNYGTVAGLQAGNRLQWADVEPHAEFVKALVSKAEEMQWRLIHDKPPEVGEDGSEEAKEALSAIFPSASGAEISLPPEALDWARELDELKDQEKAIRDQITLRENRVKELIGGATFGVLVDGRRFSWKEQVSVTPPQPEKVKRYRVLRLVKGGN
jgi:predicted phage-related endonuclease